MKNESDVLKELLSKALKKSGLKQAELSRISRTSTKTLSNILKGRLHSEKVLREGVIVKLAVALDEDPEDWITACGRSVTKITKSRIREETAKLRYQKGDVARGVTVLYSLSCRLETSSAELDEASKILDEMLSSQTKQGGSAFKQAVLGQIKELRDNIYSHRDDLKAILADVHDMMKIL